MHGPCYGDDSRYIDMSDLACAAVEVDEVGDGGEEDEGGKGYHWVCGAF